MIAQDSTGKSDYHALTLGLNKRFSHGYQFSASYTWSHAIDDSTDLQTLLAPQDNNRLDLERGNFYFDQRHRFVFAGVFASPDTLKDEAFLKKFRADCTFSLIIEHSKGRPFMIDEADDTFTLIVAQHTRREERGSEPRKPQDHGANHVAEPHASRKRHR